MKFSILVPVYNAEEFLSQCVDSLLLQTYEDYEIILVDDGSTDSSPMICDRYEKENRGKVKVIHKNNGGHISARLTAIENAQGEFCVFADSDDFIENNLLETVSAVLDKTGGADVVLYSFYYYKNGEKTERPDRITDNDTVFEGEDKRCLYENLISGNLLSTLWAKAVRTELLKNDPTDYTGLYKYVMAEDLFISIYLLTEAERVAYTNIPLYNYRISDDSISRSFRPETISKKNTLYVYDRFLRYLKKWGMDNRETVEKINARWFNEALYNFSKYYENAENAADRKVVLEYDWSSMLPEEAKTQRNNFENKSYQKLYGYLKEKRYFNIRLFFIKKSFYKNLKLLKSRLIKK